MLEIPPSFVKAMERAKAAGLLQVKSTIPRLKALRPTPPNGRLRPLESPLGYLSMNTASFQRRQSPLLPHQTVSRPAVVLPATTPRPFHGHRATTAASDIWKPGNVRRTIF